ncbi:MAG TPA: hypothetical protein VGB95_06300, partial [Chitinophagales bacterium]
MTDNKLRVSAKMALVMGIFLPVAETIRRSSQLLDYKKFFSWFDDYMLGFVLIGAAYFVLK